MMRYSKQRWIAMAMGAIMTCTSVSAAPAITANAMTDADSANQTAAAVSGNDAGESGGNEAMAAAVSANDLLTVSGNYVLAPQDGQWMFDFNIIGSATAEGWTGITVNGKNQSSAAGYQYTPEQGYGIVAAGNVQGRKEAVGNNEEFNIPGDVYGDFALLGGSEFVVDLADGLYEVSVIVGSTNSNKTSVVIEDAYEAEINPGKVKYGMYTFAEVAVTDGQLNFSFGGDGRVNGIIITDVTPVEMNFDFNIEGSSTAEGWTGITVNKKDGSKYSDADYGYTAERGYGLAAAGRVQGRKEGVGANENYAYVPEAVYNDFALLNGCEFKVDIPNGIYGVQVIVGSTNSNTTNVTVEDIYTGSLNPGKKQFGVLSITGIAVTDGQMNFAFSGDGRVNGIVITSMSSPSELSGTADFKEIGVDLSWAGATGCVSYNIYRRNEAAKVTEKIANVTGTSYKDTTVEILNKYTYWVKGVNSRGLESAASNEAAVDMSDPSVAVPQAPTGLTVTEVTMSTTSLSWEAVESALYYEVYWSDRNRTDLEGTEGYALIDKTNDTTFKYELPTHIKRYFKVVAVNQGGKSVPSDSAEAGIKKVFNAQAEYLDRGLVAVLTSDGVYVGWRLTGDEYAAQASYELYRDGELIAVIGSEENTNYLDAQGTPDSEYSVVAVINGKKSDACEPAQVLADQYLEVPLQKPESYYDDRLTTTYEYSINDTNLGDVDGDGEYEMIVKWDGISRDSSKPDVTSPVYLDCYKLDGTLLWRINLGINIRAGAHYTQHLVYDFDGDGKAEMICKTADGSFDAKGNPIDGTMETVDYRNSSGYVLSGPEYLTLFDGETGEALDTIDYYPATGNVNDWGDNYGNRASRFLSGVAYLDGEHPSAIIARGYYTRAVVVTYDVVDHKLVQRWICDSNEEGNADLYGQGAHSLTVSDVDNDGCQEIVYGSATIDDNGKLLYSLSQKGPGNGGHGDAERVSDFNLRSPGQEIFMVHEDKPMDAGIEMHTGDKGDYIYTVATTWDVGRGAAGDIDPRYEGAESWAVGTKDWYAETGYLMDQSGNFITNNIPAANFTIFWDGDLGREILDHTFIDDGVLYEPVSVNISKWDWINEVSVPLLETDEVYSINGTKGNPCFQADIFGDWREEAAWRTTDNNAIRIYTTVDKADYRLYTLMHDTQYRAQVACESSAYNQPPCTSFYIGFDEALMNVPVPALNIVGGPQIPVTDTAQLEAAIAQAQAVNADGYTEESYAHMLAALENAKGVLERLSATQEEIDQAAAALKAAVAALEENKAESVTDKSALKSAVDKALQLDKTKYTQDSYDAMNEVLESAKAVLDNPNATQQQIDAAAAALDLAVSRLTVKDDGSGDNNGDNDNNNNNGDNNNDNNNNGDDNDGGGSDNKSGNDGAAGNDSGLSDQDDGRKSPKTYDNSIAKAQTPDNGENTAAAVIAAPGAGNAGLWVAAAVVAAIVVLIGSGVGFYYKSREDEE